MPTHQVAMKIAYNRSTLHHFPPAGKRWKWGDVVGCEDGKVDPVEAHVVTGYLQRHDDDDGRYSVDDRLAEYLDDQHNIELDGSVTDPQQDTLPGVDSRPARESRVPAVDAGSPRGNNVGSDLRQLSLTGEAVTRDVQLADAEDEMCERERAADQTWASRAERSARDAQQARLTAYAPRRGAGALTRASGDVYSTPAPDSAVSQSPGATRSVY